MNKKYIASLLMFPILSVSLLIGNVDAEAPKPEVPLEQTSWTVQEAKVLVDYYADKHGLSRQTLHKVISCESSYNYKAYNGTDSHRYSVGSLGISQFSKETFTSFAKKMGRPEYDNPYNVNQALDVAAWAIKNGYGNHWSCYRK